MSTTDLTKKPEVDPGASYKTTAVLLIDMVNYINITRKLSYMCKLIRRIFWKRFFKFSRIDNSKVIAFRKRI
jgi:hypothetical protein